ncbi:alkaline phosphatase [bacterium]|nr:MAG: alkaline phosphatase [bacterium]
MPTRRQFIRSAAVATGTVLLSPALKRACADVPRAGKVEFGIITDIHQDIMHDGVRRVTAFAEDMNARKADFVFNLGDFCVPHAHNEPFLKEWNKISGARYHVLGNHDTDGGFKREQTVEFYGMPARYYSFDRHGIHFIVLDGNDPDGKTTGYPRSINETQLKWLGEDLAGTKLPTIICIHQPFDSYEKNLVNAVDVRAILTKANQEAGFQKVLAVFSGHDHLDYVRVSDGVPHIQINSASYAWTGKKHDTYPKALIEGHPSVDLTCPYADPLWAFVTLDFERGEIHIAGRETTWVGPDPWNIGLKADDFQRNPDLSRPAISNRIVKIGATT